MERAKKGEWKARSFVCQAINEGKLGQKKDEELADIYYHFFQVMDILTGVPLVERHPYRFE